jgi:hypothetical protein
MKVNFSFPITDLRGSDSKLIYSRNHYGPYTKKWFSPFTPPSTFSETQKNIFSYFSSKWSQLSDQNRIAWNEYAKLFTTKNFDDNNFHPTGKNTYVRCNCNLALIGFAPIDSPFPINNFPAALTLSLSIQHSPDLFSIDFTAFSYSGPGFILIYMTKGLTPGTFYVHSQWRLVKFSSITIHPVSVLFTEFFTRFSENPVSGKKYFCKLITIDSRTGIASLPSQSSIIM